MSKMPELKVTPFSSMSDVDKVTAVVMTMELKDLLPLQELVELRIEEERGLRNES